MSEHFFWLRTYLYSIVGSWRTCRLSAASSAIDALRARCTCRRAAPGAAPDGSSPRATLLARCNGKEALASGEFECEPSEQHCIIDCSGYEYVLTCILDTVGGAATGRPLPGSTDR